MINNASTPLPPVHNMQQPEIHIQDYINVLLRRRMIFAACFMTMFLGTALYTFMMKPVYQAAATLHIKDDQSKGRLMGELALNSSNPIDAELEILKSRSNAENVVRRLHLDWRVSKRSAGLKFRLLEFSSTEKKPSYEITLSSADSYSVKGVNGDLIGTGVSGKLFSAKGVSLLLDNVTGKTGDSVQLDLQKFNATVAAVRNAIKAVEVGKKTNIIKISYDSTDPEKARDIVNTLVQVYLDQTVAFKTEEASRTVGFVEEQLKGVRTELDSSEKDLQQYKTSVGVVKLNEEATNLIRIVSDVEKQKVETTLHKKQVEFALASLKESRKRGVVYSPAVMREDLLVAGMSSKLAELEVQRQALLSENTETYPAVKIVKAQIDELLSKIQATYETTLKNLSKQESNIGLQLTRYEDTLKKLPAAERDLARLTRLSTVNANIFTFLLQKHEEARIAKASTISNIKIVDPAITPELPSKPNKRKNLLMGLLLGLVSAAGLVFFIEYLDDSVKDAEQAKRLMKLPLLAIIPYIETKSAEKDPAEISMICHSAPKSAASEAFRSLRTSIHFSAINQQKNVLMVTSTFQGEGKSTIASNLAIIFAQTGARVLLMDCDMRRPMVHEMFGHSRVPGLSELLARDVALKELIHETTIPNLHVLNAGTIPPNPSELLASKDMAALVNDLRSAFEYIIIDSPPLLAVTDAIVISPVADLLLMVMEPGRVPVKIAARARELLATVQAPIGGLILSDRKAVDASYTYYGDYGYGNYQTEGGQEKVPWFKRMLQR